MYRRVQEAGPALYGLTALLLLRAWLRPGALPGSPSSEASQRIWELHQIQRWFQGSASFGQADLLLWPTGRGIWPAAPLADLLMLPLMPVVGDVLAFSLVTLLLLTLAGLGPYVLARSLGAGRAGALVGGLLVQLSPALLSNLNDCVLEMVSIGPPTLAAAAMLSVTRGRWRSLLWVFAGVLATAMTSPYFAIFLALCCAAVLPVSLAQTRGLWRRWLSIAGVSVFACAVSLAPLILAEGQEGRLGFERGFHVAPAQSVMPDGSALPPPPRAPRGAARWPQPAPWVRVLVRWPAGAVACLALLLGLIPKRSRPWATLGLTLFLLGPGVPALQRAFGVHGQRLAGPLQRLLGQLPLLDVLGNPTRMLAAVTAVAGLTLAMLVDSRWKWAALLAVGIVGEAAVSKPDFEIAASVDRTDPLVVAHLNGPYMIFPASQPPAWMPGMARCEGLLYSGRAQAPSTYDAQNGDTAVDLVAISKLAQVANAPISQRVNGLAAGAPEELWRELGVRQIVLVTAALAPQQALALERWLPSVAEPVVKGERAQLWRLR